MKKLVSLSLVVLVLLIVSPASASPGTLFVDDDGICGGNLPCYTVIQDAVNAANANDTVYVYAGTYYEHVTISKSLVLQGEDRNTTVVDGGGSGDVIYVTANYVTISGVTVTNGNIGIRLIPNWRIHHVTIRDVIATSNTINGIRALHNLRSGSFHVIEDCILSYNGSYGFKGNELSKSIIRNCQVFGNGGGLAPGWGFDTLIANNQIYDNAGSGIYLNAMRNSTVEQNEVWNNGAGIHLGSVANYNTIRDNMVRQNSMGMDTKKNTAW